MPIIDLNQLPAPDVVEELDFESILAERKATLISLYPEDQQEAVARKWMFKDGAVVKRIYTADEQQQQAESQKAALLSEAESVIQPLERAVRLNMATDEERARLESWERYSVLVSRVDPANPEWPEMPQ